MKNLLNDFNTLISRQLNPSSKTSESQNSMPQYNLAVTSDLIENPSPRCACIVVLDTSGSMCGEPIKQLNAGFQQFLKALNDDEVAACSVEVSVITAGGRVQEELPFTSAMSIEHTGQFAAGGMTPLGGAVSRALDALEKRFIARQA
jgi:Mg-chelatase subunit ChlD